MAHGQTGDLGVDIAQDVQKQGNDLVQIRHQKMEEEPVLNRKRGVSVL